MESPLRIAAEKGIASIEEIKGKTNERIISSKQGAEIIANNQKVVNFCSNNYLGLCTHPEVVEGAKRMINIYGVGMGAQRSQTGTIKEHHQLENVIAKFVGTQACLLYPSCFSANGSIFQTLLTKEDAVISDALNHASIIDGIRLCSAKRYRYKHMDMNDLENILKETKGCRLRLIVTDGTFSMDGDIAPIPEIVSLARRYKALTMLDEAHATGVFGEGGRGTPEYFHMLGHIDIINSTLGKAMGGGVGGFCASHQTIIDLLRLKSPGYLQTANLQPPTLGASLAAFNLLNNDKSIIRNLTLNLKYFRLKMIEAGFVILGHPDSPIIPVLLKEGKLATQFAEELMKLGIYVVGFAYPFVAKGAARIRVQMSAAHKKEDLDLCIKAFIQVAKELGLVLGGAKL